MKLLTLAFMLAATLTVGCTHEDVERIHDRENATSGPTSRTMDKTMNGEPVISESGYNVAPLPEDKLKELTKDLTPLEYSVTCQQGTERAGTGDLLDNKDTGTYICRVCGLPLFKSVTKFKSGTGWPSFYTPFDKAHVRDIKDSSGGMIRVENRCARCDSHLGHVFTDGPQPTGLRYCINSVSLDFVDVDEELPERSRPDGK